MNLKIKDYVKALPRFIDRLSINRKLETTYDYISLIRNEIDEYNELRPTATLPKSFDKFNKAVKGLRIGKSTKRETLFIIAEALQIAIDNKAKIVDYVKREITGDVASTAISYKKANILIYISTLNNAGNFIENFLWLMFLQETEKDEKNIIDIMTKAVYEKTLNDLNSYGAELIKVLGTPSEEILSAFNKAPDVVVDVNDDAGDGLVTNAMVDSLKMGFLPANNGNPFFFIGKAIIQIEDLFYQQRLEMKQLIELRLADLRSRDASTESPALQAEIERLENKLATLNYKLAKAMGGEG